MFAKNEQTHEQTSTDAYSLMHLLRLCFNFL